MNESGRVNFQLNEKRHFAFFVYLGIEYRNFFQSGLSQELSSRAKVSLLTYKKIDVILSELKEREISTIFLDPYTFNTKKRNKLESLFLVIRRTILKQRGKFLFRMFDDIKPLKLKHRIVGNRLFYFIFELISWRYNKKDYFDKEIASSILNNNVTDIVIQSYFSAENMLVAITGKSLGCKVWVVNWGWKDFYFHEYVPFEVDGLFTWSNDLKLKYLQFNKRLKSNAVFAIGNLSFDQMFNYSPARELEYYEKKYNFPKDSIIALYTMVNPVFCDKEDLVIEIIHSELKSTVGLENLIFLVKPNPMDVHRRENYDTNNFSEIVYLDNLWHYDQANDFNLITEEGQTEWMDLLYYSKLNMSVASTVTVEALIMKKPVINILFGENGEMNKEFERFFNAPFYEVCHARPDVIACRSVMDVSRAISAIINDEVRVGDIENIIKSQGGSINKFISEVYSK